MAPADWATRYPGLGDPVPGSGSAGGRIGRDRPQRKLAPMKGGAWAGPDRDPPVRVPAQGGDGPAAGYAPYGRSAHIAAFYESTAEYAAMIGDFIASGLATGIVVMAAVPAQNQAALADHLGPSGTSVLFADMTTLGRNPGRIIPAIRSFADSHPGKSLRYVGEPMWPSRSVAETAEAVRHEALLNVAFDEQPICILCPYDVAALGPAVVARAEQTHPLLLREGRMEPSPAFAGRTGPGDGAGPLPDPPDGTPVLTYRNNPAEARSFVRERAAAAGLSEPRLTDLVIAVGELAANTLRHTHGSGSLRLWSTGAEVICEVRDNGFIADSLAGRRFPPVDAGSGHGLWVVHQVCDLVEMRTTTIGTTFRLHMSLDS
jgi:anti-sigma regulatory factor (Ser/Thr protein kinase)